MYSRGLMAVLAKIIVRSDYTTVLKKFMDQGSNRDEIEEYIALYKELKTRDKIKNNDEKNIDWWGKKTFLEFKEFVDKFRDVKTKTEERKLKKMEGAELVAENDDYWVYKITNHEAVRLYGSGTKWCITQENPRWWNKYRIRNDFYFYIAKHKDKTDPLYKVAMTIDYKGKTSYWDATDAHTSEPPTKVDYTFPDKELKGGSNIEQLAEEIAYEYESSEEYAMTLEAHESMEEYLEINRDYERAIGDEEQELVDALKELLSDDEEEIKEILLDCSNVEFDTSYYINHNEIASVGVGESENELSEELADGIEALTDDEKSSLQALLDDASVYIDITKSSGNYTYSSGSDSSRIVAILDVEKLRDRIDELKLTAKVSELEDTDKSQKMINRVALTSKHQEAALAAIKRVKDKEVLKKVLRRKNHKLSEASINRLSELFGKDSDVQNLFTRIVMNKKIGENLRRAALKQSTTQNLFNKIILDTVKDPDDRDTWPYHLTEIAIEKIDDDSFVKKYGQQNRKFWSSMVERINDAKFLSSFLDTAIKDKNLEVVQHIVQKLPKKYQNDFIKVIESPLEDSWHGKPKEVAIQKLTDQNYLLKLLKKEEKEEKEKRGNRSSFSNLILRTMTPETIEKVVNVASNKFLENYDSAIIDNANEITLKKLLTKSNNYFRISDILDKLPATKDVVKILKTKKPEVIKETLDWFSRHGKKKEKAQFYQDTLEVKEKIPF